MSTHSPGRRAAAPLAQREGRGADATQLAACFGGLWQEVEEALTPIIGVRGTSALYLRSLHLTAARRPSLATLLATAAPGDHLRELLARQDVASARADGDTFLLTFRELLESLIGPSLTERLLHDAWASPCARFFCSLPAQDHCS